MRFLNFKQLLILIIIFFFLFGDFLNLKKKISILIKKFKNIFLKNKKKGILTHDFWFWKPMFYQLNYFLFFYY